MDVLKLGRVHDGCPRDTQIRALHMRVLVILFGANHETLLRI